MDIYYSYISKLKRQYDKNFFIKYADIELKTEKRFYEYTIGRYIVKNTAEKFYNTADTSICINDNGKPEFSNADLNFSISHSKDIVMV